MAIYHCSIKNIGRSSGRSAVACSAYRSGEKLHDEELNKTFDYTSKDNVVYSEIVLCENAPREYQDRQTLWNEVQKVEKAKNSRLAREWEVALPNNLSLDQAKELTRGYAQSLANEGMCVDFAIHWKEGNHHAHIMGTTRAIKENGHWGQKEKKVYKLDENGQKIPQIDTKTGEQKVRVRKGKGIEKLWERETVEANDWNKTEKVEEWRERWEEHCNRYLSKEQQVDHRSYKRQGKEQIPTVHEGYVARQMEQRGQTSDLCQYNREVRAINQERKDLTQEIAENRAFIEVLKETDTRLADLRALGNGEEQERRYNFAYNTVVSTIERERKVPVLSNQGENVIVSAEREPSKALKLLQDTKEKWNEFIRHSREAIQKPLRAEKGQRVDKSTLNQEKTSMSLLERFKGYIQEKTEERAQEKAKIAEERARAEKERQERETKVKEILERKPNRYDYDEQIRHIHQLHELYKNDYEHREQAFDALRQYTTNWHGYSCSDVTKGYVEKGVNEAIGQCERMKERDERIGGFSEARQRFQEIQERNKDKIAERQKERQERQIQSKGKGGPER